MNKAYEFVGTLEYMPLPEEARKERAEAFKENGYLPPNMIPDMDKYPVIHMMGFMEHPYKNASKYFIEAPDLSNAQVADLRPKIYDILMEIMGGDELAAEYVLLTLLSKVQTREDGLPVGISCINLYAKDSEISREIVKGLERFMKLFQAHTLFAPVDLDSLCKYDMVPKKNYDTNQLSRGVLQFLNSTCVLFDETDMKEGKSEGERLIMNMKGIAELIEQQSVKYNFQYHEQSFDCSAPVIIVSNGRSVFKNATPVPVVTARNPNPDALNDLDFDLIDQIRLYFSQVSRKSQIEIPDESAKHIQDKFVQIRKEEQKAIEEKRKENKEMGAKTLHTWLTYSKLKVTSNGQEVLPVEVIDDVIELETNRATRVEEVLKSSSE
jgi:hypothetical protein